MKLKNQETWQQKQEQAFEEKMVGRKPIDPEKKKEINVKVTKDVHRRLGEIGKITEDYGDIIERLLDFWEKHHKNG